MLHFQITQILAIFVVLIGVSMCISDFDLQVLVSKMLENDDRHTASSTLTKLNAIEAKNIASNNVRPQRQKRPTQLYYKQSENRNPNYEQNTIKMMSYKAPKAKVIQEEPQLNSIEQRNADSDNIRLFRNKHPTQVYRMQNRYEPKNPNYEKNTLKMLSAKKAAANSVKLSTLELKNIDTGNIHPLRQKHPTQTYTLSGYDQPKNPNFFVNDAKQKRQYKRTHFY
jgi:hypothetical protein